MRKSVGQLQRYTVQCHCVRSVDHIMQLIQLDDLLLAVAVAIGIVLLKYSLSVKKI